MTPEQTSLTARFDRLERQNRQLRWAVVVVPILGFAVGAAADLADWKGKTVTAEQIHLVDAQGRKRVSLTTEQDGSYLRMFDAKGETQVQLIGDSQGNGPALFLMSDKPGRVGATLRMFRKDNPLIPQGGGHLGLFTEDEKALLQAGASPKEKIGGISLFDGWGNYKGGIGGDSLK